MANNVTIEQIKNMTDVEAADILESFLHSSLGTREDTRTWFKTEFLVALVRAIDKLRKD